MRILITLERLALGGTETYSVTVAEQLRRLGHPVRLHAGSATAEGRELAAAEALDLTVGDSDLDVTDVDAAIVQNTAAAYRLAAIGPKLPQVFVIHGLAPFEQPPIALDPPPPVVVLNDRTLARVRALAAVPEIVRLRQPIDLDQFRPRHPSRPRPQRLVMLGNNLSADRVEALAGLCAELGMGMTKVGLQGRYTLAPQDQLAEADMVVGYGRSVLEGMGMGRAAYVWDYAGGDGWVTPQTYAALEADGFSGAATDSVIDGDRLRRDLAAYRPEMGALNFDLVRMHHSAAKHTEALVRLLGQAEPPVSQPPAQALALLIRAEARTLAKMHELEFERRQLREEVEALRKGAASSHQAMLDTEERMAALLGSRSWRLTAPLRRLGKHRHET